MTKKLHAGTLFIWRNRWLRLMLLSLPIVAYYLPLLLTGNKEYPGDPDYYFALYEGFRKTVLEYHQFPWWDPWIAGGLPLFGNIGFGLISISAPLVLLFGAVVGLKLTIVCYGLIGFFGARRLLQRFFETSEIRSIALAYVFTFCGFFAARAYMGHFTFQLVAFTPWIVYYYLYIHERRAWIKFGLLLGLLIDSSPHYMAIMTIYLLAILFAIEVTRLDTTKSRLAIVFSLPKERFVPLVKSAILVLVLVAYRMYYVIDFFKDYRRALDIGSEKFTTLQNAFLALWSRHDFTISSAANARGLPWTWGEIETYIGAGTLVAICLILLAWPHYRKNFSRQFSKPVLVLVGLFIVFLSLGMGYFGRFSPYRLAQFLPLFSAMRVATRWIFLCACFVLLIIGAYKGKRFGRAITFFCIAAAVELLIFYPVTIASTYFLPVYQYRSQTAPFYQERYNRVPRPAYAHNQQFQQKYWYDQNLFESTRNNIGEPFASDPLLYKTYLGGTVRSLNCPNRVPCPFVISNNASVAYWSPNEIKLVRTAPGPIKIDMNPGRGWRVNDKYLFGADGSVSAMADFVFGQDGPQQNYDVVYAPRFSPQWFGWELARVWRHRFN